MRSGRDVLVHLAALHDEPHTLESRDVLDRIAINSYQIGFKTRRNRTDHVVQAQPARRERGRAGNSVQYS